MWTKRFAELSKDHADIAGGKGASLGELTANLISVPPGFVVVAPSFKHFIEATDLQEKIEAILKAVDIHDQNTIASASKEIQELILDGAISMPKDIEKEIVSSFETLGADYVAVRSSATAEDSASAAWAGQLDTYLNTTGEALLENVRRCWASLFTPRAIFYRFEKKLDQTEIAVAVVVQKMVASEVSGVAFSVDPVTENRDHILIEGAFGLGEAVVSGTITPDSYIVTKNPRGILEKSIAKQKQGLYRKKDGGNEWLHFSEEKGYEQKLSDEYIAHLSDTVMAIEKLYGLPQDIEWALEGGEMYILQSRPITTLR